jgi:hypothetical protein
MRRQYGFSTGAIAPGDFLGALRTLASSAVDAVELSALRIGELPVLAECAASLPLERFQHVSVHAPSKFGREDEMWVVRLLAKLADRGWPIVAHPDVIRTDEIWRELGPSLWIENMDKRKPIGRTSRELTAIFERFPDAGLCLDLAHSRQCDPSMLETIRILQAHRARLRQLHLSEVSSGSKHIPLSYGAIYDFSSVSSQIPQFVPVILETPVAAWEIAPELARAREALPEHLLVPA